MSLPSAGEMRGIVERHVELWNAGEKEPWLAHMRAAAAGGLTMEDPVGTPTKRGTDILGDVWDHSFSQGAWKLTIEHLVTCGDELAMVVSNEGVVDETTVVIRSIETYRYDDDGSLHIRVFFDSGSD